MKVTLYTKDKDQNNFSVIDSELSDKIEIEVEKDGVISRCVIDAIGGHINVHMIPQGKNTNRERQ